MSARDHTRARARSVLGRRGDDHRWARRNDSNRYVLVDECSPVIRQDVVLKPGIGRVFAENFAVYGVRKVWRTMIGVILEGFPIGRCTVARLMREIATAKTTF